MSKVRSPEFPKDAPWLNTDRPLSLKEFELESRFLTLWITALNSEL